MTATAAAARGLAEAVCAAAGRGHFGEALSLYAALHRSTAAAEAAVAGGWSETFATTAALKACARLPHPRGGAAIHAYARKLGLAPSDVYVHTALVGLYAKTGSSAHARKLFDEMPTPNTVSWNTLLSAHVNSGCLAAAREVFVAMPTRDAVSWNAMISGYAKAGDVATAAALFEQTPEKNAESWNALISGFAVCGDMSSARRLFDEMPHRSRVSWIAMIGGYARQGDVTAAEHLFDEMPHRNNTCIWNAMVACYAQNGHPREALRLFLRMQKTHVGGGEEAQPDGKTFASVLSACAQLGELRIGRWALTHIAAVGIPLDDHLRTGLVDLHAKCGDIDGAFRFFQGLTQRDVVSYSAMIVGCGINSRSTEAISLYREMAEEGISPNAVTFVGLLAAYSHAGLVEEGCRCFAGMTAEHGISPTVDHYAIIVDLLGRAGRLEEAHDVANRMPVAPHAGVWGALLLACRLHGSVELGEAAARRYSELEPDSAAHLVVLANIYAAAGRWEEARALWTAMEEGGVTKVRGCSWTESG